MSRLYRLFRPARRSLPDFYGLSTASCPQHSSATAQLSSPSASWRLFTSGSLAAFSPVHIEDEPFCRQRQLITLGNRVSQAGPLQYADLQQVYTGTL